MSVAEVLSQPVIAPETESDRFGVDAVVAEAFGPGRFAKTAERLREGSSPIGGFVARVDGRVVGSVRLWPILIGDQPSTFLGPIAVDEVWRSEGIGALLVAEVCDLAARQGFGSVLLVGDAPYFERFGFERARDVRLPGPVDARRVLIKRLSGDAPTGNVRIRR